MIFWIQVGLLLIFLYCFPHVDHPCLLPAKETSDIRFVRCTCEYKYQLGGNEPDTHWWCLNISEVEISFDIHQKCFFFWDKRMRDAWKTLHCNDKEKPDYGWKLEMNRRKTFRTYLYAILHALNVKRGGKHGQILGTNYLSQFLIGNEIIDVFYWGNSQLKKQSLFYIFSAVCQYSHQLAVC